MSNRTNRFALASSRVVTPDEVRAAAVVVEGKRIAAVVSREEVPADVPVDDLDDLVISPGLVDSHVHINEPGRTEWEGFETATRAAAAGGVTTLVDMPLNSSPVTTTGAALEAKRQAAAGRCWVDVGFYGGLIPGNFEDIEPLVDAGVCGVKAFLCDSGLAEFPASSLADLSAAMPVLKQRGVPLLVHAEMFRESQLVHDPPATHRGFVASRWGAEQEAISNLIGLVTRSSCWTHIVHVSCSLGAKSIAGARAEGLPITAETCPHYLTFAAEEIPPQDARFKCAPPIYNRENRGDLWQALRSGVIDTIGSDHSPCPPEMKCLKSGDFAAAWGGISSLQLTLSAVWRGAAVRNIGFERIAAWLSANPARVCGLGRKGRIAVGWDADFCIWDPSEEWTVDAAKLQHRHKLTPYDGQRLRGRVKRTYVRGRLVYDEGAFPAGPIGELVRRDILN
jgi:allantoinase